MEILGYILISIGTFFVIIGLVGSYRFHNFYPRILASADVDTIGLIFILLGAMCIFGFSFATLKVLIILIILLILNPVVASSIVRSAYFSGYKLKEGEEDD